MKKAAFSILIALCLTLTGCGDRLLERSYSTVTPHSASYHEEDADTLRAENYQDLVNALLILIGEHREDGVVRIYGDAPDKAKLAKDACVEVQKETDVGAYLLDYITYSGTMESGYYELTVRFRYRRTAEELAAVVNATSTEALPDLLRAAVEEDMDAVAIRVGWFGTDRGGVMALVSAVHDEFYPPEEPEPPADGGEPAEPADVEPGAEPPEPDAEAPAEPSAGADGETPPEQDGAVDAEAPPEADAEPPEPVYDITPWELRFYPDNDQPGIIEVTLKER